MPINWTYAKHLLQLGGAGDRRIDAADAARQEATASAILDSLRDQPGIVLADEVGMGKTYVALGVVASVLQHVRGQGRPVVVMVPPGLVAKWEREWDQFRTICCRYPGALDAVVDRRVRTALEFFHLLDAPKDRRPDLVWMSTGTFFRKLEDPWIKLALIRMARSRTKLDSSQRNALVKWATSLVRLRRFGRIDYLIKRLLESDLASWKSILDGTDLPHPSDPIPRHLRRHAARLDWTPLVELLRDGTIPGSRGRVTRERVRDARVRFNSVCQELYESWLDTVDWRAPLLVLDEAHHAKNDSTRLASLFRSEDAARLLANDPESRRPRLWGKFDRQLFLTATPFQLGHEELVRVLRSFASAAWSGPEAPLRSRERFFAAMEELHRRLDENRLAGKQLDQSWGRITLGVLKPEQRTAVRGDDLDSVEAWWAEAKKRNRTGSSDPVEADVHRAIEHYRRTKALAESDRDDPWLGLRQWVIRHNRRRTLPEREGSPPLERRETRAGDAIADVKSPGRRSVKGLSISHDPMPFLLAARAQGELAAANRAGDTPGRAWFAEGLCSSYEAFHHTKDLRGEDAREIDDEGSARDPSDPSGSRSGALSALPWYERQIELLIPSREAMARERFRHPKLQAVVRRAVELWASGEKVLVFCFYRETARALREHLGREIEREAARIAARKLGRRFVRGERQAWHWLERVTRRLRRKDGAFERALRRVLEGPFREPAFKALAFERGRLMNLLLAYVTAPTFIARYLPLEDSAVREALRAREARPRVIKAGVEALEHALERERDGSGLSLMARVREFLTFAVELVERGKRAPARDAEDGERRRPLDVYLSALNAYHGAHHGGTDDDPERIRARSLPTVRLAYGGTKSEVRENLMLAFNSPLFPEVLVSSSVMAEGVDLHRFCRFVIHHDLCWNPSTLEQRTGRLDRIRCKAEQAGKPITIFEPFIAGSADEKMYRVVRDRERWFQVVMGQKFEFDEAAAERYAARIPLPESLAAELVFDLTRYRPKSKLTTVRAKSA